MPKQVSTVLGPLWVPDDHLGHFIEHGSWWDQQIKPAIDEIVERIGVPNDAWAIDLGANVGWFSIYLASGFARVLAIEAHPETFVLLLRNLQARLPHVMVAHVAAYDRRAAAVPIVQAGMAQSSTPFLYVPCENCDRTVQCLPIDELVPSDAHVALIKSDVQGCDLRALKGLERTIKRCRPRIIWEWEPALAAAHGDDWAAHERFFGEIGYSIRRIREDLWDFVSDPVEAV